MSNTWLTLVKLSLVFVVRGADEPSALHDFLLYAKIIVFQMRGDLVNVNRHNTRLSWHQLSLCLLLPNLIFLLLLLRTHLHLLLLKFEKIPLNFNFFSSFLLRISAICWSCFCSVFSEFSCNRWRTSTAVLDDDVSVKLFDLRLFAASLPSGRDYVPAISLPDSARPAPVWPWGGGDDIPSGDVELFSSRNLLFHLGSSRSFFQQCMMVKGSTFSYICTASSICRYEYEYKLHRLQNKQMEIREMEDNMNGSIPDPAHFFRSHSAYQQLLCAHRTCSSLSESTRNPGAALPRGP